MRESDPSFGGDFLGNDETLSGKRTELSMNLKIPDIAVGVTPDSFRFREKYFMIFQNSDFARPCVGGTDKIEDPGNVPFFIIMEI